VAVAAVQSFTEHGHPLAQPHTSGSNSWLTQPWAGRSPQKQQQQQPQEQQQPLVQAQQQPAAQALATSDSPLQLWQDSQHVDKDVLIQQLQQCHHWQQVSQVVALQQLQQQNVVEQLDRPEQQLQQQHLALSFAQVSATLQRLCKVCPAHQLPQQFDSLLSVLADTALQHLPDLHHTQVGQMLAMFQVLGFKPSISWERSVLQHAGTQLVHYTPAELALLLLTATQTATRFAQLPFQFHQQQQHGKRQTSPAAGVNGSSHHSPASSPTGEAMAAVSAAACASSSTAVKRANTVLTTAWLQHFMATFQRFLSSSSAHPQLQPQHLEAVITCLAALKVVPDRFWLYLFVRQMSAQLPTCPPASLVRMLSALAALDYKLPEHVISQIERQVGGAALASLRPQECVEVVKSVSVLKQKPSEAWVQQLLSAALKGCGHLNASAVVALMAATAGLGVDLDPGWVDCLLMQARAALHALSALEHVNLIDALSTLHHRPGPVFMSVYMTQVQNHLPELSLAQQALLIASLAAVGYKPAPGWMTSFMGQLMAQRVTVADASELLKLLVALRRMQYVPNSQVAAQIEGLIDSMATELQYPQLQQLRAALDDLQYKPTVVAGLGGSKRSSGAVTGAGDAKTAVPGAAGARSATRRAAAAAASSQSAPSVGLAGAAGAGQWQLIGHEDWRINGSSVEQQSAAVLQVIGRTAGQAADDDAGSSRSGTAGEPSADAAAIAASEGRSSAMESLELFA
jgi:hypothetical protein